MQSAKLSKVGISAAVRPRVPAIDEDSRSTGFRPSRSAARPQNGAVRIIPTTLKSHNIPYLLKELDQPQTK